MDAVEFIKERQRMCNFYGGGCEGCPASDISDASACLADIEVQGDAAEQVKIVEEWSAAHPRKTRQSVFLEQWPDTQLDKEGNVIICPKQLCKGEEFNKLITACRGTNCYKCRREFYTKGVE